MKNVEKSVLDELHINRKRGILKMENYIRYEVKKEWKEAELELLKFVHGLINDVFSLDKGIIDLIKLKMTDDYTLDYYAINEDIAENLKAIESKIEIYKGLSFVNCLSDFICDKELVVPIRVFQLLKRPVDIFSFDVSYLKNINLEQTDDEFEEFDYFIRHYFLPLELTLHLNVEDYDTFFKANLKDGFLRVEL